MYGNCEMIETHWLFNGLIWVQMRESFEYIKSNDDKTPSVNPLGEGAETFTGALWNVLFYHYWSVSFWKVRVIKKTLASSVWRVSHCLFTQVRELNSSMFLINIPWVTFKGKTYATWTSFGFSISSQSKDLPQRVLLISFLSIRGVRSPVY